MLAREMTAVAVPAGQPNASALTAAALKLDPTDRVLAAKVKAWRQEWQSHAWDFDETLSEIHYAHDYYGNTVSRVRLYAGFQVDPDDPPIPLDDFDDADERPEGSSPEVSEAALDEMRRLDAGADGGLPAIAGDFAVNLALAGEGYLYGKEDEESLTGESFAVYSVDEFKPSGEGYAIHPRGSTLGSAVGPDDFVLRVWRRFRRFRDLADAPMRALLDDCDNLLLLKRVLKAASGSRMHGGILLVPSEWSFPQRATDPNAAGQAVDDPLNEQIMLGITTPLQNPESVSSVAPTLIRGPADTLDKARWIDLGRGYGSEVLEQIEKVRRILAVGLDLPIEVIEGHMNTTFSNAQQIAEDTFRSHIEPLVLVICRALTDGYLHPMLRARGLDPTGYMVGYDASSLIGTPDTFDNAMAMHTAYALSDEALRRSGGASEEDKPSPEEIERRIYIDSHSSPLALSQEAQTGAPGDPHAAVLDEDADRPTPPPIEKPEAAMVAAGVRPLDQLGQRLAKIDQDLRARIQTLADAALQRALDRAGAMVARKARPGRASSGKINAKLSELAQELGREHVLSMGLSEDKLIDGELGELEPEYRKLTQRALAAALLAGRRAVPDGDLGETRERAVTKEQEQWVAGGFAVLSAAVLNAAHDQLFTPAATPTGPGEIDLSARVDPSAIRESIAVAGGTPAQEASVAGIENAATPAGGVATGTLVMDTFREALQILPEGWQWVYGYPDRPFEPHERLEGVEFSSWSDPILANDSPDGWPPVDFYRPGDHGGCACSYIPIFASDRPEDDNENLPEEG